MEMHKRRNYVIAGIGIALILGACIITPTAIALSNQQIEILINNGDSTNTINAKKGTTVGMIEVPAMQEGYYFVCWEDENGNEISNSTILKQNQSLYARVAEYEYTITYYINGESFSRIYKYSDNKTIADFTNEVIIDEADNVFYGWYLSENMDGEVVESSMIIRNNMTLYGKSEQNVFEIVYFINSVEQEPIKAKRGDCVSDYLSESLELENYTFLGWYTTEDGQQGSEFNLNEVISCNLTIYAVFKLNTQLITFTVNDINSGSININELRVDYGSIVFIEGNTITIGNNNIIATPNSKTQQFSYSFENWSISNETMITEDICIIAYFKNVVNEYLVTFVLDEFLEEQSISVPYGTEISELRNYVESIDDDHVINWFESDQTTPAPNVITDNITLFGEVIEKCYSFTQKTYIDGVLRETKIQEFYVSSNMTLNDIKNVPSGVDETCYNFSWQDGYDDSTKLVSSLNGLEIEGYFTVKLAKVEIIINYGDNMLYSESQTLSYLDKIDDLVIPVIDGYDFKNWQTMGMGGGVTIEGTTILKDICDENGNLVLYGIYAVEVAKVKILNSNGEQLQIVIEDNFGTEICITSDLSDVEASQDLECDGNITTLYFQGWVNEEDVSLSPETGFYVLSESDNVKIYKPYENVIFNQAMTLIPCYGSENEDKTLEFTLINDDEYSVSKNSELNEIVQIPLLYHGRLVTTIEDKAFSGSSITEVVLPDSILKIGAETFSGCTQLTEIILPQMLKSVGTNAFANCSSLKFKENNNGKYLASKDNDYYALISIDSSITSFIVNDNTQIIASGLLEETSLESIFIPGNVKYIDTTLFNNCSIFFIIYCGFSENDLPEGWNEDWANKFDITFDCTTEDYEGMFM